MVHFGSAKKGKILHGPDAAPCTRDAEAHLQRVTLISPRRVAPKSTALAVATSGAAPREGRVYTPPWNKKTASRIPSATSTPSKAFGRVGDEDSGERRHLSFEVLSPGRSQGLLGGNYQQADKENITANQYCQPLMTLTMQLAQSTSPAKPRLYSPHITGVQPPLTWPSLFGHMCLCECVRIYVCVSESENKSDSVCARLYVRHKQKLCALVRQRKP